MSSGSWIARAVFKIGSGTALGQLAAVLSAPVLARLYAPEAFGTFAAISAAATVVSAVATLRLELALPLPRETNEAAALARVAVLAVTITSTICAIGVGTYHLFGAEIGGTRYGQELWFLPVFVFLTAMYTLLSQASLRERAYGAVAVRAFAQNGGTAAAQIGLGLASTGPAGLLGGQTIGRLLALAGMAKYSVPYLRGTHAPLGATLGRYRRFPLVLAPSAALNVLGTSIPVLVISQWYGANDAGNLGVAQQVVLLPASLISAAIGQVFVGELTQRLRGHQASSRSLFLRASGALLVPALVLYVGVTLLAEPIIPLVLGNQWVTADDYAVGMATATALGVVVGPLSYVLIALDSVVAVVIIDVLRVVLVAGAGLAVWALNGPGPTSATAMFATTSALYVVTWLVCLQATRRSDAQHRAR